MHENNTIAYTVVKKTEHTPEIVTLHLLTIEGQKPEYHHGQYINVYFRDLNTPEGKAYSMSSPPSYKTLDITVKRMGDFSNRLCDLSTGNVIIGSLPYGYFYSEEDDTDIVLIAGGIGTTPFMSMVQDLLHQKTTRNITLLWSVKKYDDLIAKNMFDNLAQKHSNFTVRYFVTQDDIETDVTSRRIDADDLRSYIEQSNNSEFFLCGSIAFVRDFWRLLKNRGVPEEKIYTESFF